MSNIVAAIGRGQLEVLDARVTRRRAIFAQYEAALGSLAGIRFMPEANTGRANRWLSVMLVDAAAFGCDREHIRLALEAVNIESRPMWKPMHLQPVFKDAAMVGGAVSEALFRDGLCLPSGSSMSDADVARVVAVVKAYAKA
jgi:dTDP-4-amino-4,6-dideoxygalactose transaminase